MIKSKMKETEASHQRNQNIMAVLKPILFFIVLIFLLFTLFLFLSQQMSSKDEFKTVVKGDHGDDIEDVEEIIAEMEGD